MKQIQEINQSIQDIIAQQQKVHNIQRPFKILLLVYLVKQGLQNLQSIEILINHLKKGLKTLLCHKNTQKLAYEAAKIIIFSIATKYGTKFARKFWKKLKFSQLQKEAYEFRIRTWKKLQDLQIPDYDFELIQKVLNSDVQGLKDKLDNKEISSVQIVNIFMKQCQKIATKLELITEQNYEYAIQLAEKCDQNRFKLTEKQKKNQPLYGIPFSIKDSFVVEGMVSTCGLIKNISNVGKQNGRIIELVLKSGAIPMVKSNVPQMLIMTESDNHVWGNAKNPWDPTRTSGGSSGGESGLIAAKCSPLGLGTDIGSSIRQPAAYCGLAGLKPTTHRVSMIGHNTQNDKKLMMMQCCLRPSAGPIGKTTQDCALMMEALLNKENFENLDQEKYPKDFFYTPKPFNKQEYLKQHKKLKIGYYKSLDIFESCPAHQRGVQETVDILTKLGHECVEVQIPNVNQILNMFVLSVGTDALYQVERVRQDEPLTKDYQIYLKNIEKREKQIQNSMKNNKLVDFEDLVKFIQNNEDLQMWDSPIKITSIFYKMLSFEVQKAKSQFLEWFANNQFDALISPVTAFPALKLGTSYQLVKSILYSALYNILDIPAGNVPITLVQENEQDMDFSKLKQKDLLDYLQINMKKSAGLPVGVQIASLPDQEEKILNIMNIIEKEVKFQEKHKINNELFKDGILME